MRDCCCVRGAHVTHSAAKSIALRINCLAIPQAEHLVPDKDPQVSRGAHKTLLWCVFLLQIQPASKPPNTAEACAKSPEARAFVIGLTAPCSSRRVNGLIRLGPDDKTSRRRALSWWMGFLYNLWKSRLWREVVTRVCVRPCACVCVDLSGGRDLWLTKEFSLIQSFEGKK